MVKNVCEELIEVEEVGALVPEETVVVLVTDVVKDVELSSDEIIVEDGLGWEERFSLEGISEVDEDDGIDDAMEVVTVSLVLGLVVKSSLVETGSIEVFEESKGNDKSQAVRTIDVSIKNKTP